MVVRPAMRTPQEGRTCRYTPTLLHFRTKERLAVAAGMATKKTTIRRKKSVKKQTSARKRAGKTHVKRKASKRPAKSARARSKPARRGKQSRPAKHVKRVRTAKRVRRAKPRVAERGKRTRKVGKYPRTWGEIEKLPGLDKANDHSGDTNGITKRRFKRKRSFDDIEEDGTEA